MVGITYRNNHDLDQPEIVNLLVTGWWDSYLTEESRDSIKHATKKNDEGFPTFDKNMGCGILDDEDTLIYITPKHFTGIPSNISSQVSDLLKNLRSPTASNFRWYQDVFISRVMLRKECHKPYWKEKFIDGLPPIFAHEVKQALISKNDSIDHDNLTYSDIFNAIKKFGINICNDKKLLKHQLQNKKKAKYKRRNFCEQYGLSPIAPSKKKGKKHDKSHKIYSHKKYKNNFVKPNNFHAKKKNVFEKYGKQTGKNKFSILNIDNKDQEELVKILESNNLSDSWKDDFSS